MDGLIAIDVETGGLDPRRHALLAIGLFTRLPDNEEFCWTVLVQRAPQKVVELDAARLNGWEDDLQWARQGAIPLLAALGHLLIKLEWLRRQWRGLLELRMLAHNAGFDRDRFLTTALLENEIDPEMLWGAWECSMSAMRFCRRAGLLPDGQCGLDDLTQLRTGDSRPLPRRIHRAGMDARLCFLGYEWLLTKCGRAEPAEAPSLQPT
jgi:hypothetical protein